MRRRFPRAPIAHYRISHFARRAAERAIDVILFLSDPALVIYGIAHRTGHAHSPSFSTDNNWRAESFKLSAKFSDHITQTSVSPSVSNRQAPHSTFSISVSIFIFHFRLSPGGTVSTIDG